MGVGVNNKIVTADVAVNEKWAQVQNVYQRRADLIPNLVETVKGFATQERTVLEEVTQARASAGSIKATPELLNDPAAFKKFQDAQNQLGAPSRASSSPWSAIRSSRATRISSLCRASSRARRTASPWSASASTRRCATTTSACALFPASFIAALRGFKEKPFFESAPGSENVPKVKF